MSLSDHPNSLNAVSTTPFTEQARLLGTSILMWSLMLIIVSFRFVARHLSKAALWYDDWLILPATLSATTCFVSAIWMTRNELGQNIGILAPDRLDIHLKGMLIAEIGWVSTICIVKCSILAFYWRLFNRKGQSFCVTIWAFFALTMCWGVAVLVISIIQCSPVHTGWQVLSKARCLKTTYWFFVGSAIPHITIDIALIGLPMLLIRKTQMRRSKKALLSAIFGLGGFVTIVAVVRLVYLLKLDAVSPDTVSLTVNISIWTGIEVNMSIICACLPSLRPVATLISDKLKQLRTRKSMRAHSLKSLTNASTPVNAPIILPTFKIESRDDRARSTLDSSFVMDVESKMLRIETNAIGNWVSEVEIVKSV